MVKYCVYCGTESDDEALFCTSCGKAFPNPTAPPQIRAAVPVAQQSSALYTAELGAGSHKHMLTDVFLKDSAGNVVLVARLQSLLHRNYTLVDGAGTAAGFIEEKTHLTHRTFTLQDPVHNPLSTVSVSNVERNRAPPNSWIEDSSGNRLANVVFAMGLTSYSAITEEGSSLFQASLTLGSGVRDTMESMAKRTYAIQVNDSSFSLQMVLTTIAALDQL